MQFDSSSLTFLQTQKLNQHPKKTNRPIFATQHVKSEQMFQTGTASVSKSFLYQQGSNQQRRSNQSQNLTNAFFAQSENKNPPQKGDTPRQPLNPNTIQKPSFSSCLRDSRLNESQTQNQDSRCVTVHSTLNSPPCQNQKLKAVQSFQNYIVNSNMAKNKQSDINSQSQYSTTNSNIFEEQVSQIKTELHLLLKEENQNIMERLVMAESQLNLLLQSGVFHIIDKWSQQQAEQNQFVVNIQLKCQDIEIKTDQVEYNQKDQKQQNQDYQYMESKRIDILQDQYIQMKQLHHENVEATQKILEKDLQDLKSQFSQILITKGDVEKTLHKIILESSMNTNQGSQNQLNTPNQSRPQEQDPEQLNQYINRYEQFNRDVTNYMASRQVPQQFYKHQEIEEDQVGSLNQSDVENYDLNDSTLQRHNKSPSSNEENKFDSRFIKQQNDYQFDLYDLSKHQQVDHKIKNIYVNYQPSRNIKWRSPALSHNNNNSWMNMVIYWIQRVNTFMIPMNQISQLRESNMLEVLK